jgi:DNA-binding transcriptional MerR regulator
MANSQDKLTTNDIARALGANPSTIVRYADRGAIKCEILQLGQNNIRLFDADQIPVARALLQRNSARNGAKRY